MNNPYVILGIVLLMITIGFSLLRIFKNEVIQFLLKFKTKRQLETLRTAIHNADADKNNTGRKNIVIYNSDKRIFEPVQKKLLKRAALMNRKKIHRSSLNTQKVKQIEKKSLYVTR